MSPPERIAGFDLAREPLEEAAARACRLFVEVYRGLESRRVAPGVTWEELTGLFRGTLQDEGVGLLEALVELEEEVLPRSMGTPHPLYLGLVNSSPLPGAALADLLASALNNNGGAFHQSPAMTALEEEVVRSFAARLGIGDRSWGMILPGGTFATLQGLALARARHFPRWGEEGPGGVSGRPTLYASTATHFSVERSGQVLGLGRRGVVAVPTTGRGAMDVDALEKRLAEDRAGGAIPFAVVATLGTTGTGALDPLPQLADLCRRESLWLHVDACYGGAAALVEELRPAFDGIERADSVAVDPHKWFFIPITAALLLHRHPELEAEAFSVGDRTYIPHEGQAEAFLRGIPTSRRASSLAVWAGLRAHGWNAVRQAVRRNIQLTRLLEELLQEEGFTVLPDGRLSIACARWEPAGSNPDETDRLQAAVAAEVVATGEAWFSTVRHAGRTWLRFNLVNLHTREHHIRRLAELVTDTAQRLMRDPPQGS